MARKMKDSGIEWIGEIPEGWEVLAHKYIMHKEKSICEHYSGEDVISLTLNGVVKRDLENPSGKMPTTFNGYQFVDPNDLLLCLFDIDVTPRCVGLVKDYGVTSPAYSRFKIYSGFCNAYYNYLLRFIDDEKVFIHLSKNLRSSLTESDFGAIKTIVPPKAEQQRIADYLDNRTFEIDTLLSKARSSIEEYKKLKQAVITQAVATQQCSHIKLKHLMNVIVDCPHETPTYSFTGNYYVIRTADQALASLRRDEDMYRLDASEYKKRTRRLTLDKDDSVYGREGERWGLACIVPESNKYCLGQRIMQFRCNTKFLYPKYAMYTLNSEPVYLQGVADTIGSTSPHVNISTICNYLLPVPALTEQKEIADYLDAKCAEIDGLIAKKEQLVKELESYKKSLIYEVVTGKRKV